MATTSIDALIARVANAGDTTPWAHCQPIAAETDSRQALGKALAELIVQLRCGANDRLFNLWSTKLAHPESEHSASDKILLEAHLLQNLGTPEQPAPAVHLQGLIVEHLWYALTSLYDGALGMPVRVEEPSWSVTDPGLDGLAIYRPASELVFRLWELKWHGTAAPVRNTVSLACTQLKSRALKYLARHAKLRESEPDDELLQFYVRMPEMWVDVDERTGAGIGVATLQNPDLDRAFEPVATLLPFQDSAQREGLIAEIPDFGAFADFVREEIWKGL